MIKEENYRPLIIRGQSYGNKILICKVVKKIDEEILNALSLSDLLNMIQVLEVDNLQSFKPGFSSYLFENEVSDSNILRYLSENSIPFLTNISWLKTLDEGDIIEINNPVNYVKILYRINSSDNFLQLTNRCNNNCIFCPDSLTVRQAPWFVPVEKLKRIISLMNKDTRYLCITGGEPTLFKDDLFEILSYCSKRLPNTEFMILSNGRMFFYKQFTEKFLHNIPQNMLLAIPLYADTPDIHDYITSVRGSFYQTFYGLKNLYNSHIKLEIRIVVSKLNYQLLPNIAQIIINHFPQIYRVNFMAMELLGNAAVNKEQVWIDFDDVRPYIKKSVLNLLRNGIPTYLYNFPLCFVDESMWQFTVKSISDYKVRYKDECEGCIVKEKCGGFFFSTVTLRDIKVRKFT